MQSDRAQENGRAFIVAQPEAELADFEAQFALAELQYSPEERAEHEAGHAIRRKLDGGVLDRVTLYYCLISERCPVKSLHSYLQFYLAGLCSSYLFGRRRFLELERDAYELAIWAVRSGDFDPTHDLQNVFHLLLQHDPNLDDNSLIRHANLALAECHQRLRDPDVFAALVRCAEALCREGYLTDSEVSSLMAPELS
jgi:hypothetical protein